MTDRNYTIALIALTVLGLACIAGGVTLNAMGRTGGGELLQLPGVVIGGIAGAIAMRVPEAAKSAPIGAQTEPVKPAGGGV